MVNVRPGAHVLHGIAADNGRLRLEARPGELYFIALHVTADQSHFEPADARLARRTIRDCCARLENWAPGQRPLLR